VQEENCVLDNFHSGHSVLDHRPGHGFRAWGDALVIGSDHDFRFNEFRLSAHIFELTGLTDK
jgi:hypothetical protein